MYGIIPGLADANRAIFAGPLAFWFWVVRIGLGLAIPLLLLLTPKTRTPAGLFVTCCLVFLGIFADRAIFVGAGQIVPGTAVGGVVSDPFTEYAPTVVEIVIVLGAFGFFGLVYTLVERYLPMGEHTGHLAGGFLSGSHPAPAMVDAGVAWLGGNEDVEYREHNHSVGAEAPLAQPIFAAAPAVEPAAVEPAAVEPVAVDDAPAGSSIEGPR
jgi:hypothetical protein